MLVSSLAPGRLGQAELLERHPRLVVVDILELPPGMGVGYLLDQRNNIHFQQRLSAPPAVKARAVRTRRPLCHRTACRTTGRPLLLGRVTSCG
ncbi:hypothetical protein OU415_01560 [Saccharopolyspora sp. WRP15-2]|uniref:Uncharacterized protein n=1 Tax=Saccharopolyspora oryzae TaxID=2997343 RepID=A0ABT4UQX7_9PSEU|nr:hypothetical protein [Saccharopolyspora oryzae]MDA3624102.1 hypothetical protein [Saccharopolyspora oryzae]